MFLFSKLSFKIGIDHSQNGSHIREVDTQLVYVFLRPYVMSALIKEIAPMYHISNKQIYKYTYRPESNGLII